MLFLILKDVFKEEFYMGLDLLLIAIGLSMDAFAVAVCKGLAVTKVSPKHMLLAGLWFGGFQALMPLIGYFLGNAFSSYITGFDHWIAFVLLAFIGGKMIKEALDKEATDSAKGYLEQLYLCFSLNLTPTEEERQAIIWREGFRSTAQG